MNRNIRIIVICILIVTRSFKGSGQDMLFSQPAMGVIQSNSAFSGIFDGKYRVGAAYRNQFFNVAPKNSYSKKNVFFDIKFNVINNDYFSVGAIVSDEQYGIARIGRSTVQLNLNYAKMLSFNRYQKSYKYLAFGTTLGFGKLYSDSEDYTFGIQFDRSDEEYDENIPSGELVLNHKTYPDINAGLLYYQGNRSNNFYIGLSASHLNQANISIVQRSSSFQNIRYTFITGGQIGIGGEMRLFPITLLNFQSGLFNVIAGSQIGFVFDDYETNSMRFGMYIRATESINSNKISDLILTGSFRIKNLTLGLSYDLNTSSVKRITGMNGAFEMTCIYIAGNNPVKNVLTCPEL